jgi:hypothetical protein
VESFIITIFSEFVWKKNFRLKNKKYNLNFSDLSKRVLPILQRWLDCRFLAFLLFVAVDSRG